MCAPLPEPYKRLSPHTALHIPNELSLMAITITFPSFGEFNALFKASHFKKRELGILPSFTMCFPLQKAVGLLLGLSAIYRWQYLGRSRLTTPVGIRLVVTLLTTGVSMGIPNPSYIGDTH